MTTPTTIHQIPEAGEKPSWKWDVSTYLLIGGLLLFNIAVFVQPNLLDSIVVRILRVIDFRLWPWWYFVVLLLIVGFSVKWFFIYRAWNEGNLDEVDGEIANRFVVMSAVITAETLLLVFMHATTLLKFFVTPLWLWFRFGTYSHMAAITFLFIMFFIVATLFFVKEWLALVLRPN